MKHLRLAMAILMVAMLAAVPVSAATAPSGERIVGNATLGHGGAIEPEHLFLALLDQAVPLAAVGAAPQPLRALEPAGLTREDGADLAHGCGPTGFPATPGSRSA